jgi:superfamily I DNA/RNA helicase
MTYLSLVLQWIKTWYEIFKADPEECLYIREMLRSEEKLNSPARVKLSTIHAAKGGEATNVLLILDNTKKIRDADRQKRRQTR